LKLVLASASHGKCRTWLKLAWQPRQKGRRWNALHRDNRRAQGCVSAAKGWLVVMMKCENRPLSNPLASPLGKAKHPISPLAACAALSVVLQAGEKPEGLLLSMK